MGTYITHVAENQFGGVDTMLNNWSTGRFSITYLGIHQFHQRFIVTITRHILFLIKYDISFSWKYLSIIDNITDITINNEPINP